MGLVCYLVSPSVDTALWRQAGLLLPCHLLTSLVIVYLGQSLTRQTRMVQHHYLGYKIIHKSSKGYISVSKDVFRPRWAKFKAHHVDSK